MTNQAGEYELILERDYPLHSPRSGKDERYTFSMKPNRLVITRLATKRAICELEGAEAIWSGHGKGAGDNPLLSIMADDGIHAPAILPLAFQHVLMAWTEGGIHQTAVLAAAKELFSWVNATTNAKPKSELLVQVL